MKTTKTLHLKFGPHAVCLATEFLACRKVRVMLKKKRMCTKKNKVKKTILQRKKFRTDRKRIADGQQMDGERRAKGKII